MAPAVDGLDDGLGPAGVTNRLARRVDPAGQRRFGDEAVTPDVVEQIVLGDRRARPLDQVGQDVEDLAFDADHTVGADEGGLVRVELECVERVARQG